MKHRWILLLAVLLTATVGLIGAVPTSADAVIDPCVIDPDSCVPLEPQPIQLPGVARFNWSMQDRYNASWDAWSTTTDRYSQSYVNPTGGFVVNLDACGSEAHGGVRTYTWTIAGPSPAPTPTRVGGSRCRFTVRLSEATYNVTLTVTGRDDRYTKTQQVKVDDMLIISLGDSNASGEGNPEFDGSWEDWQCHRSQVSGPAKAARLFEEDPHRSVTFLSLACSGAEITSGLIGTYGGMETEGERTLDPQVTVAKQLLCGSRPLSSCGPANVRHIDALLVSIGINDIGFSDTLMACMLPDNAYWGKCDRSDAGIHTAWSAIHDLPGWYEEFAAALATGPTAGADVYLTEYPDDPFDSSDGCWAMNGVSDFEAEWMHTQGRQLNAAVENAANRPRWMYVGGVADEFRGHGYCAGVDDTWFIPLIGSLIGELSVDGTMHPNPPGHAATGRRIYNAVKQGPPDRTAINRATITFQQVKLTDTKSPSGYLVPNPVNLWTFSAINSGRPGAEWGATSYPEGNGIPLNQWLTVPPASATFTLDLSTGDEFWVKGAVTFPDTTIAAALGPGTGEPGDGDTDVPPPSPDFRVPHINEHYNKANGYGTGSHVETASYMGATLSVRYTITVRRIIMPPQPPVVILDPVAQVNG